jgi:cation-transporting P-type ATPase C
VTVVSPRIRASGQIHVLSSIPGRTSFRFLPLRDRQTLARGIEAEVRRIAGVTAVSASPRTARVLIFFDPAQAPLEEIVVAITLATPLSAAEVATVPAHEVALAGEFAGHRRRLAIGGAVLAGLLVKRLVFGAAVLSGNPLLIAVSTAATLISGYPFLRGGLRSLSGRGGLDTDALVTTATLTSLLLRESVMALIVIWLLNLGEYLQALTLQRVHHAIKDLLTVGTTDVWLVAGGTEVRVPVDSVQPGDVVAVYTGETIPVDGVVLEGSGPVNEAPITGESMPSYKNPGDAVFAGTILEAGSLRVRADRIGTETAVGRLIQRIEQARELQAPIATVAEGFSRRFVPLSFVLSLAVLILTRDVRRAMTMLVIACPCAAGLSTPTAVSAAIGNAARRGVLIKGGVHLEAAAKLDTVIFDKTGTLTVGRARVAHMLSVDSLYSPEEVLRIAASGELHSNHPLGIAIVRYTQELEVEIPNHEECEVIVGRGMRADMGGNRILVGSVRLLRESNVPVPDLLAVELNRFHQRGETVLCVAVNGSLIGLIGVRDVVRPETRGALEALRRAGIKRVILLSGDNADAVEIVAQELGLTEYQGDLLPEDKFRRVRELQEAGCRVAMIGDGINDAPALAIADLGVAMGTAGSDVAIEAADVALAGNDLRDVARVLDLSRRTLDAIRQNYALSLGVNALGLFAGAAGALSPVLAAVMHNTSTIAVVLNSGRLIGYRQPRIAADGGPSSPRHWKSPTVALR